MGEFASGLRWLVSWNDIIIWAIKPDKRIISTYVSDSNEL